MSSARKFKRKASAIKTNKKLHQDISFQLMMDVVGMVLEEHYRNFYGEDSAVYKASGCNVAAHVTKKVIHRLRPDLTPKIVTGMTSYGWQDYPGVGMVDPFHYWVECSGTVVDTSFWQVSLKQEHLTELGYNQLVRPLAEDMCIASAISSSNRGCIIDLGYAALGVRWIPDTKKRLEKEGEGYIANRELGMNPSDKGVAMIESLADDVIENDNGMKNDKDIIAHYNTPHISVGGVASSAPQ